jgi:hypothetical protein
MIISGTNIVYKNGKGRFDLVGRLQDVVDGERGVGYADDLLCSSMSDGTDGLDQGQRGASQSPLEPAAGAIKKSKRVRKHDCDQGRSDRKRTRLEHSGMGMPPTILQRAEEKHIDTSKAIFVGLSTSKIRVAKNSYIGLRQQEKAKDKESRDDYEFEDEDNGDGPPKKLVYSLEELKRKPGFRYVPYSGG